MGDDSGAAKSPRALKAARASKVSEIQSTTTRIPAAVPTSSAVTCRRCLHGFGCRWRGKLGHSPLSQDLEKMKAPLEEFSTTAAPAPKRRRLRTGGAATTEVSESKKKLQQLKAPSRPSRTVFSYSGALMAKSASPQGALWLGEG